MEIGQSGDHYSCECPADPLVKTIDLGDTFHTGTGRAQRWGGLADFGQQFGRQLGVLALMKGLDAFDGAKLGC